ncbi:uncharacterized protein NECHADRAFT_82017 [Fusarium vanettenii 77-13-4]|uniref:Zn(2)-C6 fungal-type domain-containing protein n=1 Tax=Fusarium vanettenii (strain ATCC MYA-4622 / CBS 123669 / FGSC 9596 / NRRL 45880 / 77-13-4) TaxID=660122 RepID=C7ZA92_FUSV7|nr:uncharacterized protein NECHADRAFT_82017 [Fusarium vanettenii 77-13-4]EEU39234.1 hypothetical protein NECHADRAFT_82017 [Fusarium vanettenii 77-13-4]
MVESENLPTQPLSVQTIPSRPRKRIGFRKSRNGCLRCKTRKVKTCVPSQSPLGDDGPLASTTGTPLVPFPFLSVDPADAPECWLSNAELIFHYTNVTCRSILSGHAMPTYQVVIPQEGLSHPYLMRMIMALSSFHLAYLNKDKRPHYLALANKQQSLAVRGLRGTLGQAVTQQNCHALWVSSIFLAISKFAFSPSCDHRQDGCCSALLNLVDIFSMINGMMAIMRSSLHLIQTGPLKAIFNKRQGFRYARENLQELLQRLSDLDGVLKSMELDLDPSVHLALTSALERLISCVTDIIKPPDSGSCSMDIKILFIWPSEVSQGFFDLVRARHPLAVIILAHYCCLIRWSASAYWFCRCWGRPLADSVLSILEDSDLAHWAEWSVKVMREDE